MVVGFMVFWPLGLAMLAYILWGDRLEDFKGDWSKARNGFFGSCRKGAHMHARTGNIAFDTPRWSVMSIKNICAVTKSQRISGKPMLLASPMSYSMSRVPTLGPRARPNESWDVQSNHASAGMGDKTFSFHHQARRQAATFRGR
jgi:hypothetical protein